MSEATLAFAYIPACCGGMVWALMMLEQWPLGHERPHSSSSAVRHL